MNASQATDALTEAALLGAEQDLTFRGLYLGRRKLARERSRKALTAAMPHLPSPEKVKEVGFKAAKESLRLSIMGDLISAGVIVLLFTIVPALAWSVLVSVIAGLLIHWILTQQTEYGLIQQARGLA